MPRPHGCAEGGWTAHRHATGADGGARRIVRHRRERHNEALDRNKALLPAIVEGSTAGVPDERITLVLARGTHRPNSDAEIAQIVGEELASRLRIVHHDPDGPCTYVGTTSRGTKVEINAEAARCDRLILTGGVVHHAMAGYGGGRKSIVPGIASRATVKSNHLWVIDPEVPMIRDVRVGSPGEPAPRGHGGGGGHGQRRLHCERYDGCVRQVAGFFAGRWPSVEARLRAVDRFAACPVPVDRTWCWPPAGLPADISITRRAKPSTTPGWR